jgi:hypothetical protein
MPQGVTSASLIVVILIGAAVGAVVGGMLGTTELSPPLIAVISGFVATVVAVIARNKLLYRLSGAGPDDTRMPALVGVFAIIASIAGSLAAKEILDDAGGAFTGVWLGTVAGISSAVLMSLLMITYHMYPEPRRV